MSAHTAAPGSDPQSGTPPVPQAAKGRRITWVDSLKGIAIVLVVAVHLVALMRVVGWEPPGMRTVNALLFTLRMPSFYFAAGLFFARNIERPWSVVIRDKALPMLYLYVLWSLVYGLVQEYGYWPSSAEVDGWNMILHMLDSPRTSLWFLLGLGLYFVLARATAGLPYGLGWVIAALISLPILSGYFNPAIYIAQLTGEGNMWTSVVQSYIFFFAAVKLSSTILNLPPATVKSLWAGLGCAACWLGLALLAVHLYGNRAARNPLFFFTAVLGLAALVLILRYLDTGSRGTRLLQALGTRTQPVFLLHVLVIAGEMAILGALTSTPQPWIAYVAYLGCIVVTILASLALWRVLRAAPFLFTAPWLLRR